MKLEKAITVAIEAMTQSMKKITFEARLGMEGSDVPYHQNCMKKYSELENAIKTLSNIMNKEK